MKKATILVLVLAAAISSLHAQQDFGLVNALAVPGIQAGSRLVLTLTGNASEGKVWGTDLYTADSSLAAAAVHAGVLNSGQTGTVTIEILPGTMAYQGTSRNGVVSSAWSWFRLSFRFSSKAQGAFGANGFPAAAAPERVFVFADPVLIGRIGAKPGMSFYFQVTGSTTGNIWGSGPYTLDSSLAVAAVHSGALQPGQKGMVKVIYSAGQNSYASSSRNGVTTANRGSFVASYTVEASQGTEIVVPILPDPGNAESLPGVAVGQTYTVWLTGKTVASTIWGSDVYTSDSSLALSAVHAGILADKEAGAVTVKILPGRSSYDSATRNGVTSMGYGGYPMSFSLEAAR